MDQSIQDISTGKSNIIGDINGYVGKETVTRQYLKDNIFWGENTEMGKVITES